MKEEENQLRQDAVPADTTEEAAAETAVDAADEEQSSSTRRRSVFPYLAILFATAFLLLLFAYLMQQRDSEEIIVNLGQLRESMGSIESIDQLLEENRQLREALEKQKETEEELRAQVDALDSERQAQDSSIQELTGQLEEQQAARNARAVAVLYLEQMEYLVETDQLDKIVNPLGGMEAIRETLAQIDEEIGGRYPEGWATLTERYQAVVEAIEGEK